MKSLHYYVAMFSLFLAAGCANVSGSYKQLQDRAPKAGNFQQSLAAEYMGYAEYHHELGNSYQADYYAAKGLKVLETGYVHPEDPADDMMRDARTALASLMTNKIKRVAPQKAARAQLLYDCWNYQHDYTQADEKPPCGAEFDALSEELDELSESFTHKTKRKYIFQFTGDDAQLTDAMQETLDIVAQRMRSQLSYRLELHAMPFARGKAYDNIAQIRAEVIRHALTSRKVDAWRIEIEDDTTAKTVYLSHDRKEQPKNSVLLRIKMLAAEGRNQ